MPLKIGILYGGKSAERAVSLRSGEAIYQGLKQKGYDAIKIDTAALDFLEQIKSNKVDLIFIGLHGKHGEDGTIQGFLETLDIPYTGSGVLASAIAMDKVFTKKILLATGIPTPDFCTYTQQIVAQKGMGEICNQISAQFSLPVVIKAPTQGSTIGISFVKNKTMLPRALAQSFKYDQNVMVEEFISGTEITVTIIGNNTLKVLPQIEIVSATGVYDYHAKYTVGMSKHIIPPRLPDEYLKTTADLALRTYSAVGCRGLSRVDLIVTTKGKAYVLEINTLPGMTETSLVPDSARAAGIEFPDLVDLLVKSALDKNL
ncbi:D-alanine--D-alanine ligase [Peptococcaceae bacterium]|nr:D-alanine--D-alanine ligase [Peptococcaceae bacterium]